jgi:hypothetical protein
LTATKETFMSWLFLSTDVPPIIWFWVLIGILASAVGSYMLYRILLTPLVEFGESHPANVRRGMWFVFTLLTALASSLLLASWLRPTAYVVLAVIVTVLCVILLFSRKRA